MVESEQLMVKSQYYKGRNLLCQHLIHFYSFHTDLYTIVLLTYTILTYIILSYTILTYIILSYIILTYIILSYTILTYIILSYIILTYIMITYIILTYIAEEDMSGNTWVEMCCSRHQEHV